MSMMTPAPADLQRWSEELARNPASLAFLPLARAYRRQGRLDLSMRLCLRGLEHHPEHVEAHALLALLYLETGDRARAADEWATVLRLKPGNFEALRGMGFRYLEQGEIGKARQHLERAALIRPTDTAVQEALRLLRSRPEPAGGAARAQDAASAAAATNGGPSAGTRNRFSLIEAERNGSLVANADAANTGAAARAETPRAAPSVHAASAPAGAGPAGENPLAIFDGVLRGPVIGAVLLDVHGLVLAGRLTGDAATRADEVGAVIGGVVEEIVRTVAHLGLRGWRGILLECGATVLHVSPVSANEFMVLALRSDTPRGWIQRAVAQTASLAEAFLRGVT
jgi:hypothetical protein